jgi:membrane protease YdiL (CAAX protease family)
MTSLSAVFARSKPAVESILALAFSFLILLLSSFCSPAHAQDPAVHDMHAAMSMPMEVEMDSAKAAKLLADKRESEFNHHVAGFFVVLAGLFILAEADIRNHWPSVRYAWPFCFVLSGLFVLIWSDTELWPFGPQSWYYGLAHLEVLQHKIFAVLLLAVGVLELQRARGILQARWSRWIFPFLAVAGSSLLFFHGHQAGMHGPHHSAAMQQIQAQHFSFSMAGFGIGFSKGLAETRFTWQPFFERLFPALLIALGALLMVYVE